MAVKLSLAGLIEDKWAHVAQYCSAADFSLGVVEITFLAVLKSL